MDNKFDLMRDAVKEAEATMRAADLMAVDMADMIKGKLRYVNNKAYRPRMSNHRRTEILKALKKELRDFNAVTGEWK